MKHFDMDDIPVLIIGAGISGLGAAQALRGRGIACCILDAEAEPGVPWHNRHPQLRLNTHRKISQLPGLAIAKSAGDFPRRDTVVDDVQRYAANLGVPIRYGCRVNGLRRADAGWHVETSEGTMTAWHVVIATGRDREPVIPDWLGRDGWSGRLIHAHDLGEIGQYCGKHVLVVGAGNSGMDVLNHLSGVETASLTVSVRFGPGIIPKYIAGFPLLRLSPILSRLAVWLLDPLLTGVGRLLYGDLRRHGLTRHANGGAKRLLRTGVAPAIDNGAIAALKLARIRVVPAISRFREQDIELAGGLRIAPAVVIAATGYTAGPGDTLHGVDLLDARGFPVINGGEQHASAARLWFTGMRPGLTGFFHASTVTGRAIAQGIEDAVRRGRASGANAIRGERLREARMELAVDRLLSADGAASTSREVCAMVNHTVVDRRRVPEAGRARAPVHSDVTIGLWLGFLGVAIFGATLPVTKLGLADFSPWFITFVRALLAGVAAAVTLAVLRRPTPWARWAAIIASSLMLVVGFPGFMAVAMQSVPASHGGVVLGILPLATAIMASLIAGERPSMAFWGWGVAGAGLVLAFTLHESGLQIVPGDVWLFASGLPAFSLGLSDLSRLIYIIGNATLGGDPSNDSEGILVIGDFIYAGGPGPVDFCLENAVCGLIFAEDAPTTSTAAITVSEAVAQSPVPLPAPALLLIGGLVALGALSRSTKVPRQAAKNIAA